MATMHTKFELAQVNESLAYYHRDNRYADLPISVTSYADYIEKLPIIYDHDLRETTIRLLNSKALKRCSFTISSATSSEHKMLAQSIWRSITPESYPYQLVLVLLRLGVFNSDDIVANLFSAGGMSTLYDGCNRLLEGCKTSILPVGRLDANPRLITTFLELMNHTGANVLFGTPSSIHQCARLSKEQKINLSINKIVFTGEMFSDVKRSYVKKSFQDAHIYGLYGHSETGFIGITTPQCNANYYHLLTDFFIVETTENGEVLVTDLTKPLIPLFRYYVGDVGALIDDKLCPCGSTLPAMLLKGRCDKKFNYMGNLVSYTKIKDLVNKNFQEPLDIQVQLSTDSVGRDLLTVVIDDDEANLELVREGILNDLVSLGEISEGMEKGAGSLDICSSDNLVLSYRQKMPLINDNR